MRGVSIAGRAAPCRTCAVLGAGLLWFGWFGFNAGSPLGANAVAGNAFVVTNTAAAMGALAWMTVSWLRHGHPCVLGAAAGAVAGLVAITPAAGFVDLPASIVFGLLAGTACCFAVDLFKYVGKVDDALGVCAVRGVGGIVGARATGVVAQSAVTAAGGDGLLYGNPALLGKQCVAAGAVALCAAGATWVLRLGEGGVWLVTALPPRGIARRDDSLGLPGPRSP